MFNLKNKIMSAICAAALLATTVVSIVPVSASTDVDNVAHTGNFYTDILNSDCYLHKEGISSYEEKGFMAYYVYDTTAPDGNNFVYRINYPAGLVGGRYMKLNQYNTFGVESGTKLRVEFKYKLTGRAETIDQNACIFWGNDDPAYGKGVDTSVVSDEWKTFSYEFESNGADHQSIIIQDCIDIRIDDIQIAVMNENGEYEVKKTNNVNGDDSLPGAVTDLSATENQDGTVTLNYTLPQDYETKVHKVRAYQKKDGVWVQIGAADYNQTSITAATVGANKEYAVATVGWNLRESVYAEVKDETKYITSLNASASADTVTLTWDIAEADTFKTVEIYKTTNGLTEKIDKVSSAQKKYLAEVEGGTHTFKLVPIADDNTALNDSSVTVDTVGLYIEGRNSSIGDSAYMVAGTMTDARLSGFQNQVYDEDNHNWMARLDSPAGVLFGIRQHFANYVAGNTYRMSFRYNISEVRPGGKFELRQVENKPDLQHVIAEQVTDGWQEYSIEFTAPDGSNDCCWIFSTGMNTLIDDFKLENITGDEPQQICYQTFGGYGSQVNGENGKPNVEVPGVIDPSSEILPNGEIVLNWTLPSQDVTKISRINVYEIGEDFDVEAKVLVKSVLGNNTSCVIRNPGAGEHYYLIETLNENEALTEDLQLCTTDASPMSFKFLQDSIKAGEITAKVSAASSEFDNGAYLAVALYNNGVLEDISTNTPTISDSAVVEFSASVTVPQIADTDKYVVKAFLWETANGMKPICDNIILDEMYQEPSDTIAVIDGVEVFQKGVPHWTTGGRWVNTCDTYLTHDAYSNNAAMLITGNKESDPTNCDLDKKVVSGDKYKIVFYEKALKNSLGSYMVENIIRYYEEYEGIELSIIDPDTNESVSAPKDDKWYRLEAEFTANGNHAHTVAQIGIGIMKRSDTTIIIDDIKMYHYENDEWVLMADGEGIRNGDFED